MAKRSAGERASDIVVARLLVRARSRCDHHQSGGRWEGLAFSARSSILGFAFMHCCVAEGLHVMTCIARARTHQVRAPAQKHRTSCVVARRWAHALWRRRSENGRQLRHVAQQSFWNIGLLELGPNETPILGRRPNLGSNSANLGPMSTNFEQQSAKFCRPRGEFCDFIGPRLDQSWPDFVQICPMLAGFGKLRPIWPSSASWAELVHALPNSFAFRIGCIRCWPNLDRFGHDHEQTRTEFGHILAEIDQIRSSTLGAEGNFDRKESLAQHRVGALLPASCHVDA